MNHRSYRCLVAALIAIGSSGCGEQTLPETPPGSSRAGIEHPLDAAKEAKQVKVSAKTKAAMENAAKSDPRGK